MKNIRSKFLFPAFLTAILMTPGICLFASSPAEAAVVITPKETGGNDAVASGSETIAAESVGTENMVPVTAGDLAEGTYEITVDSSSSMFRIVGCELAVSGGEMSAAVTLSGTSYTYLFPGTAEEAAAAGEAEYIPFEDVEGKYVYHFPVPALNEEVPCAAFSKNKEKWYDRTLVFRADSIPEENLSEIVKEKMAEAAESTAAEAAGDTASEGNPAGENAGESGNAGESAGETVPETRAAEVHVDLSDPGHKLDLADGIYTADLELTGGTGKASVSSPVTLTVKDGQAKAAVEWSSPNYDYMIVNGEKYLTANKSGNSVFAIPVAAVGEPIPVIADTTAMSTPHEVEYTLTFSNVQPVSGTKKGLPMAEVIAVLAVMAFVLIPKKKKA